MKKTALIALIVAIITAVVLFTQTASADGRDDCLQPASGPYDECESTTTVPTTDTIPTTIPESTTTTEPECTGDHSTDPSGCPIDDCNLPGGKPAECDSPDDDSSSQYIVKEEPDYAG